MLACALLLAFGIAAQAEPLAIDTATSTAASLRGLLHSKVPGASPDRLLQEQLLAFYETRNFTPVWSGGDDENARAQTVESVLEHADEQGLHSADYVSALSRWSKTPEAGRDAAEYDLAMTGALFRYARDVHDGRFDPGDVYKDVRLPPHNFDAAGAFSSALREDSIREFLDGLPPQTGYSGLIAALARYRTIDAEGGWPVVPGKKAIALDGTDARAALLTKRLGFEDPILAANPQPSMADLREAVLRFQRRNGLTDDGKVGPEMLKALNVPASARILQIVANMERWRWMPRKFESSYILVNVPDQSLDFVRDESVMLHSRVVIGTKNDPTPILRTMVNAVVANPPWDIPDDIVAKSILPKLRRSPNYLVSRDMVLADGPAGDPQGTNINWQSVNAADIPYQFQQSPGPDNVLGSLMLDMPNEFNVYLHDTPNKEFFLSGMRQKSHGCVRVEKIFPLASLALTGGKDDGADEIQQAIASGETQRLQLPAPLPAYLVYWTAIAEPDGTVGFRPDLYGRDRALLAKLKAHLNDTPKPASPGKIGA